MADQKLFDVVRAASLPPMSPYARPGVKLEELTTNLGDQEPAFRSWVMQNKVPYDLEAAQPTDYDMRGFYKALMSGDPRAASAVNPNDKQIHYPDYWKTPLHHSFSAESQWAGPVAPQWNERDQLVAPSGKILVDEKARATSPLEF